MKNRIVDFFVALLFAGLVFGVIMGTVAFISWIRTNASDAERAQRVLRMRPDDTSKVVRSAPHDPTNGPAAGQADRPAAVEPGVSVAPATVLSRPELTQLRLERIIERQEEDIEDLKLEIVKVDARFTEINLLIALFSFVFTFVSLLFGRAALRDYINTNLTGQVGQQVEQLVQHKLNGLFEDIKLDAEFRGMASAGRYREALRAFFGGEPPYEKHVSKVQSHPFDTALTVLDMLCKSKQWKAAEKLYGDLSARTLSSHQKIRTLALQVSIQKGTKQYREAKKTYARLAPMMSEAGMNDASLGLSFYIDYLACLRRTGSAHEAQELLGRLQSVFPNNIHLLTRQCAIYRDLGDARQALHGARPTVNNILSSKGSLPDGWNQLLTNHIAVCNDESDLERGADVSCFLLERDADVPGVNAALLLASRQGVPDDKKQRILELADGFLKTHSGSNHEQMFNIKALWHVCHGHLDKAKAICEDELSNKSSDGDRYYILCRLADILMQLHQPTEAIAVLNKVTQEHGDGEVHFRRACAYKMKGESSLALSSLGDAMRLNKKWKMLAEHFGLKEERDTLAAQVLTVPSIG